MDLKEIRSVGMVQRLQEMVWPCGGDLRTATISVGLTSLVSTALLTLFFVEDYLAKNAFGLIIVAVCVVALFLVLSDIALLFGAVNKISTCLVPWMALHSALQVFLLFYFVIKFTALAGYRAVILASFSVVAYFILIVFLYYKQLTDEAKDAGGKKGNSCTAAMDMEAMNGNVAVDDTFTAIASRDVSGAAGPAAAMATMDDSGEFAVPTSATDSKKFAFPEPGAAASEEVDGGALPKPVEVIEVATKTLPTNPFLQDIVAQQKKQEGSSSDDESRECLLEPEETPGQQRNATSSRTDLLDIDNKFTPFKPKSGKGADGADLPKMKVFLPKTGEDDDSDCSSTSSTQK